LISNGDLSLRIGVSRLCRHYLLRDVEVLSVNLQRIVPFGLKEQNLGHPVQTNRDFTFGYQ
jgi:hypothetical protein